MPSMLRIPKHEQRGIAVFRSTSEIVVKSPVVVGRVCVNVAGV